MSRGAPCKSLSVWRLLELGEYVVWHTPRATKAVGPVALPERPPRGLGFFATGAIRLLGAQYASCVTMTTCRRLSARRRAYGAKEGLVSNGQGLNDPVLQGFQQQVTLLESDDRKAADALDQVVLVGGPAAILASLTFIKDIAPQPVAGSLMYLTTAWVLLLAGGVLGMVALFTTRQTARVLRRLYEEHIRTRQNTIEPSEFNKARKLNVATRWMTYAGLGSFLAGVGFLLVFAQKNLPAEKVSSTTAAAQSDTASAAILRECARTKCAIFMGYDYDLPRDTMTRKRQSNVRPTR